jgi:fatty acid-binding protein DegV
MIKRFKKSFKQLIKNSKTELKETKQLAHLIWQSKSRELTEREIETIKNQGFDIIKVLFLSGLFIIPGSGFIIVLLVKSGKRFGINLLPSSFAKEK